MILFHFKIVHISISNLAIFYSFSIRNVEQKVLVVYRNHLLKFSST